MNADDNELLINVFSSTFEDFAFMFGEEALELGTSSYRNYFKAKIGLIARVKGFSIHHHTIGILR